MFPSPIITETIAKIPFIRAKEDGKTINLPIPTHFLSEEIEERMKG